MSDFNEMAERHADRILRAAGSGLRHYTLPSVRAAILLATLDCISEACRDGAERAVAKMRDATPNPSPKGEA